MWNWGCIFASVQCHTHMFLSAMLSRDFKVVPTACLGHRRWILMLNLILQGLGNTMRISTSVKYLCIRWSIQLSLSWGQSQTLHHIFGFGLWGTSCLANILNLYLNLFISLVFSDYNFVIISSLAHSELSTVFYEKILILAWGWV